MAATSHRGRPGSGCQGQNQWLGVYFKGPFPVALSPLQALPTKAPQFPRVVPPAREEVFKVGACEGSFILKTQQDILKRSWVMIIRPPF